MTRTKIVRLVAAVGLVAGLAACGGDEEEDGGTAAAEEPTASEPAAETGSAEATGEAPATGEGITLAINPWTGSAVNANVARVVLEAELGTPVEFVEIDEFATWPGMEDGSIDAGLSSTTAWPSASRRSISSARPRRSFCSRRAFPMFAVSFVDGSRSFRATPRSGIERFFAPRSSVGKDAPVATPRMSLRLMWAYPMLF